MATAEAQVQLDSTRLPIVIINSDGFIPDEPKIRATMGIIDNPGLYNYVTDPFNDYEGFIGIEIRGSSSQWLFPKKNYGVELRTLADADTSASILGLPAEEDWILHGPYSDKTLMRNMLTFELWSHTGRYGSRTRYLELIVNDDYKGVYVLMEKVKRDSVRIDINKLKPDENSGDNLTGGYIVKLDKFEGSNSRGGWASPYVPPLRQSNQEIFFQYEYPKGDLITAEQKQYIENYITTFEYVLNGESFANPATGYAAYINDDSFIDFALINELTRNVDGYRLSTFLHKDKDSKGGKLNLGPIWDFNLALGNANYCDGSASDGWAWDFNMVCPGDFWLIPFWWDKLLSNARFVEKLNNRWDELRSGAWSDANIMNYIDSTAAMLEVPQQRNFQRWDILGEYIWPNNFVGATYQSEVDYIKSWLTQRLYWLDIHIADRYEVINALDEGNEMADYMVYPNSFDSHLSIHHQTGLRSVHIYNTTGMEIIKIENINNKDLFIDTSGLTNGIYYLQAYTLSNGLIKRKLIKVK
jgi:hypothetical protein